MSICGAPALPPPSGSGGGSTGGAVGSSGSSIGGSSGGGSGASGSGSSGASKRGAPARIVVERPDVLAAIEVVPPFEDATTFARLSDPLAVDEYVPA